MVKNWALAIGINQYDYLQPLKYAKRDAQLIQNLLSQEADFERVFLFSDDSFNIDSEPTRPYRANLLQFLQQLCEKPFMEGEDNFWFFFSGHGMVHRHQYYLMPSDGDPDDVENTGISLTYLVECLCCCGSENIILILDASRQQCQHNSEGIGRQTPHLAHQTGVISIFACSPNEYSSEIDALQTGAFTHALLEGLGPQGQCATLKRLYQYLSFRVPELVAHYKHPQQTPYSGTELAINSGQILIPKYASLDDIVKFNTDKLPARNQQNIELAKQLWMGENILASSPDKNAVQAILRIAQLRRGGSEAISQFPSCSIFSDNGMSKNKTHSVYARLQQESTANISETKRETNRDYLGSERGVDYQRLQNLLANGNWKEADRETFTLMLNVAKREKEGWLNIESINKFSYTDLYTIDQLWVKYSNGRFGFSVQKRIWESAGGQPDSGYETWCEFCDRVGWRVNHAWLFYADLKFSANAPLGHFPAAGLVNLLTAWGGWVVGLFSCLVGFSCLASRIVTYSTVADFPHNSLPLDASVTSTYK